MRSVCCTLPLFGIYWQNNVGCGSRCRVCVSGRGIFTWFFSFFSPRKKIIVPALAARKATCTVYTSADSWAPGVWAGVCSRGKCSTTWAGLWEEPVSKALRGLQVVILTLQLNSFQLAVGVQSYYLRVYLIGSSFSSCQLWKHWLIYGVMF